MLRATAAAVLHAAGPAALLHAADASAASAQPAQLL